MGRTASHKKYIFWFYFAIIFLCLPSSPLSYFFPLPPMSSLFIFSLFYYPPPSSLLMLSCLLVLIFIYRFSSFSLPFFCTDGTLQFASHSASYFTSPPLNTFRTLSPCFCCKNQILQDFAVLRGRAATKSERGGWTRLGCFALFKSH